MLQWLRNLIQRLLDWLMPGGPPHQEEILEAIRITNTLLATTETNNAARHQEVLAALAKDPVTVSMVWIKKRREPIK